MEWSLVCLFIEGKKIIIWLSLGKRRVMISQHLSIKDICEQSGFQNACSQLHSGLIPLFFLSDPIFLAPVAQIFELVSKAAQREIIHISTPDIKYHHHSERDSSKSQVLPWYWPTSAISSPNPSHSTQITSPWWWYFYGRSPISHREFPLEMVQLSLSQIPATCSFYSSKITIRRGSFLKSGLDLDLIPSTSQILVYVPAEAVWLILVF